MENIRKYLDRKGLSITASGVVYSAIRIFEMEGFDGPFPIVINPSRLSDVLKAINPDERAAIIGDSRGERVFKFVFANKKDRAYIWWAGDSVHDHIVGQFNISRQSTSMRDDTHSDQVDLLGYIEIPTRTVEIIFSNKISLPDMKTIRANSMKGRLAKLLSGFKINLATPLSSKIARRF